MAIGDPKRQEAETGGPPAAGRTSLPAVAALGLLICSAIWFIGPAGPRGEWVGQFLCAFTGAWVLYGAAAVIIGRSDQAPRLRQGLTLILLVALALRVIALAHRPPTSTDIYRYVWDGRQIDAGINPYRYRPDAPEVAFLRDANWRAMEFHHIRTMYPPLAELLFAGIARVRAVDELGFRWAFLLFDMGSVLLIVALLTRSGRDPRRVIWYAWNPLVVTEVAAGGHLDAAGVCFLLLALVLMTGRRGEDRPSRGVAAAAAYTAAVLAKGQALFALPFFVRSGGWRFLAIAVAVGALLFVPFRGAGGTIFGGLSYYLAYWETNSSLFYLIDSVLKATNPLHLPALDRGMAPNYIPHARALTSLLLIAVIAWLAWRQRRGLESLLACTFAVLGANLLLSAPVLPWYLIWTVPALCWWSLPGWLLFTYTASAGYYARWLLPKHDHVLLLWGGYAPVYGLLVWQWLRSRPPAHQAERRRENDDRGLE